MTNTIEKSTPMDDVEPGVFGKLKQQLGLAMVAGLGIGLIFGGFVGLGVVLTRGSFAIGATLVCLFAITAGAPILVYAYRKSPSLRYGDPDTPRGRRLGKVMFALMAFAVVIMLPFIIRGDSLEGVELYSNGPVPVWVALFLSGAWLIGMPTLTYINRINMDELERTEMQFGETMGFQFFGFAAPIWWIGARAGLLPDPDIMIMFVGVVIVSVCANLYRKVT